MENEKTSKEIIEGLMESMPREPVTVQDFVDFFEKIELTQINTITNVLRGTCESECEYFISAVNLCLRTPMSLRIIMEGESDSEKLILVRCVKCYYDTMRKREATKEMLITSIGKLLDMYRTEDTSAFDFS